MKRPPSLPDGAADKSKLPATSKNGPFDTRLICFRVEPASLIGEEYQSESNVSSPVNHSYRAAGAAAAVPQIDGPHGVCWRLCPSPCPWVVKRFRQIEVLLIRECPWQGYIALLDGGKTRKSMDANISARVVSNLITPRMKEELPWREKGVT
ncbi:hypothetical protein Bbelb_389170 [Branchiostoma belcheri]|nr:hypothetical protein Bbelb_389170 [Branchiostoma belcheri]